MTIRKHHIKTTTLLLMIIVIASGCSLFEEGEEERGEMTRDDAREIAESHVRNTYQFVQYDGYDLHETGISILEDNAFSIEFEFDVQTDVLPERVTSFAIEVEVRDWNASTMSAREITE